MQYIDKDGMPVTVYTPNERKGGLLWGMQQTKEDVWVGRHVIVRLFLRDFTAQFKQKMLGYLWALLAPLLGIFSFLFMYFAGILEPGDGDMPYPLYVLLGSSIWNCFPGTLGAVSGGLQAQADLIMRTRIPKMALAMSSLAGMCYSILLNMVTIGVVLFIYKTTPTAYFFIYPLLVLPLVLLGIAIGLILSVVGVIAKDMAQIVMQGLSFVMYITPIVYVRETIENNYIKMFIDWNPLTYLVEVPRSLLVNGHSEHLEMYFWVSLGIICCVIVGVRVFYLLEDLVAERL